LGVETGDVIANFPPTAHLNTMNSKKNLFFVGGGVMAFAILGGLQREQWNITVAEIIPERRQEIVAKFGVSVTARSVPKIHSADIVVLAVKPQQLQSVLEELKTEYFTDKVFVSIMAGIPLSVLRTNIHGERLFFVRTMPNTPLLVGKGVTGVYVDNDSLFALIERLLGPKSKLIRVKEESDLDKITALSGSGPAYFFAFIEALREAAKKMGFEETVATEIALGTCVGASELAQTSSLDVSQLREQVTSKGGTTERALHTFETGGLFDLVYKATSAALCRAQELAQIYQSPSQN
jgi:pyrroline-5-carboxylate reductase